MEISNDEIEAIERALLPEKCCFSEDARAVIRCWENKDILACPGSGKTTVVLAKLKLLASRMPLAQGRGVCVLSHTNIAVNEFKDEIGDSIFRISNYPNFSGTLQSFVQRYIAFPYLRQFSSVPIRVLSKDDYANIISKKLNWNFRHFIDKNLGGDNKNNNQSQDSSSNLRKVYLKDGALFKKNGSKLKLVAGAHTDSAQEYVSAVEVLLRDWGLICYDDAYGYALKALNEFGESIKSLISQRFRYVFVDEYQDCSFEQVEILRRVFGESSSVLQKIGDIDQSIYNNDNGNVQEWEPEQGYLTIKQSNRYGQEIADVLSLMINKYGLDKIQSTRGKLKIKPTLFLFDSESIHKVLPAYIAEIKSRNLVREAGVYKAIGACASVDGLKISDYWNEFKRFEAKDCLLEYSCIVYDVCEFLEQGHLCKVELLVREYLCQLSRVHDSGEKHTMFSMKNMLREVHGNVYISGIFALSQLKSFSYKSIDEYLRVMLCKLLSENIYDEIDFRQYNSNEKLELREEAANIYKDLESDLCVSFNTVHGVKGETHDATLYLETECYRNSDISRFIELLDAKSKKGESALHNQSKKLMYVGLSRPRHLLCLAMKKRKSKKPNEGSNFFRQWNLIDLTSDKSTDLTLNQLDLDFG